MAKPFLQKRTRKRETWVLARRVPITFIYCDPQWQGRFGESRSRPPLRAGSLDVSAARLRAGRGESQGLTSMQERVTLAGGTFDIESAPGRGTTIRARFPFETG